MAALWLIPPARLQPLTEPRGFPRPGTRESPRCCCARAAAVGERAGTVITSSSPGGDRAARTSAALSHGSAAPPEEGQVMSTRGDTAVPVAVAYVRSLGADAERSDIVVRRLREYGERVGFTVDAVLSGDS